VRGGVCSRLATGGGGGGSFPSAGFTRHEIMLGVRWVMMCCVVLGCTTQLEGGEIRRVDVEGLGKALDWCIGRGHKMSAMDRHGEWIGGGGRGRESGYRGGVREGQGIG